MRGRRWPCTGADMASAAAFARAVDSEIRGRIQEVDVNLPRKAASVSADRLRDLVPKVTGKTARSIRAVDDRLEASEVVRFLSEGTSRIRARHYMDAAVDAASSATGLRFRRLV